MLKNKKFSLFKTKSKEEKAIEQIRKKKAQIEKLKEEILKMGRLVLKEGRLQRDEAPQQDQTKAGPAPAIDVEYTKPQVKVEEPQDFQEPPMFTGRSQPREIVREMPPEPAMFRGRQQQQQQQYQPPTPQELTVDLILVEGQVVQVKVSVEHAQTLLDNIQQSIEQNVVLVVGNRAINPKHIIMYQYV